MQAPKVRCRHRPASITLQLTPGPSSCSRDFFLLVADAIEQDAIANIFRS